MKKQKKLTQQEKEEKDFKQFSNVLCRMLAQAYQNPRQLRRVKAWYGFIGTAIEELEKKEGKC